ncbi:MAG: RsmD family RNA methyltransferase [bacterium]|nr:MAG: RsmD family RNA methyltransferase [bacterium]
MRVIAGNYKGRKLHTVAGLDVRPTSDRLRETLFNILTPYIVDSHFLDICSGSGAVAIEALSRGARQATLIERSRQAIKIIYENIEHCKISTIEAKVLYTEATTALKQLGENNYLFDIVFFDPPYQSNIYLPVLQFLGDKTILSDTAIVVVEHHSKSPLPEIIGLLDCYRTIKQGETQLSFYKLTTSISLY